MDINETNLNSATVLALAGRLDGLASPALEGRVTALVAAGSSRLVFDCARLDYVSSAGLRVFLTAAKKTKAAGGKASFAALTPAVRELFEFVGPIGTGRCLPSRLIGGVERNDARAGHRHAAWIEYRSAQRQIVRRRHEQRQ